MRRGVFVCVIALLFLSLPLFHACEKTCWTFSCDELIISNNQMTTCAELEATYFCNCTGCTLCGFSPTPSRSIAPTSSISMSSSTSRSASLSASVTPTPGTLSASPSQASPSTSPSIASPSPSLSPTVSPSVGFVPEIAIAVGTHQNNAEIFDNPIIFTFAISGTLSSLSIGDILATGNCASSLTRVSQTTYSLQCTAMDGKITRVVALHPDTNAVVGSFQVVSNLAPLVTIRCGSHRTGDFVNDAPVMFTFQLSNLVQPSAFSANLVTASDNCNTADLQLASSGVNTTFTMPCSAQNGQQSSVIVDTTALGMAGTASFAVVSDLQPPVAKISLATASSRTAEVVLTVQFDEPVLDASSDMLTAISRTQDGLPRQSDMLFVLLSGANDTHFPFKMTDRSMGSSTVVATYSLFVESGRVRDVAGNLNALTEGPMFVVHPCLSGQFYDSDVHCHECTKCGWFETTHSSCTFDHDRVCVLDPGFGIFLFVVVFWAAMILAMLPLREASRLSALTLLGRVGVSLSFLVSMCGFVAVVPETASVVQIVAIMFLIVPLVVHAGATLVVLQHKGKSSVSQARWMLLTCLVGGPIMLRAFLERTRRINKTHMLTVSSVVGAVQSVGFFSFALAQLAGNGADWISLATLLSSATVIVHLAVDLHFGRKEFTQRATKTQPPTVGKDEPKATTNGATSPPVQSEAIRKRMPVAKDKDVVTDQLPTNKAVAPTSGQRQHHYDHVAVVMENSSEDGDNTFQPLPTQVHRQQPTQQQRDPQTKGTTNNAIGQQQQQPRRVPAVHPQQQHQQQYQQQQQQQQQQPQTQGRKPRRHAPHVQAQRSIQELWRSSPWVQLARDRLARREQRARNAAAPRC